VAANDHFFLQNEHVTISKVSLSWQFYLRT
jgi:hypothetical protein